MEYVAGHCGKCGAPYFIKSNLLITVYPEQNPRATCACWNVSGNGIETTSNQEKFSYPISPGDEVHVY